MVEWEGEEEDRGRVAGKLGGKRRKGRGRTGRRGGRVEEGGETYDQRWQQLNDWLGQHQAFWQPAPFMTPQPAWTRAYPELAAMLAELSDADCQYLDDRPVELAARAARWLPSLEGYADIVQLPALLPSDGEASVPSTQLTPPTKREA